VSPATQQQATPDPNGLVVMYGPNGRNGKGTIIRTLRSLSETFYSKSFEPELCSMVPTHSMEAPSRSRWPSCGVPGGVQLQETKRRGKIDSAWSTPTWRRRRLCPEHEKTLTFRPTHKLWLAEYYKAGG